MKADRHIFLTGFMGAGKTTLGSGLAALMRVPFKDLDTVVSEKAGRDVHTIFEKAGEPAFRKMETEALREMVEARVPSVIALGGGTVCLDHNLSLIKENGLLIYLRLPSAVLVDRLAGQAEKRPLLRGYEGAALKGRVEEMLSTRQKYYNQAHIVVNALNLTPHLLYREIAASLETMPR